MDKAEAKGVSKVENEEQNASEKLYQCANHSHPHVQDRIIGRYIALEIDDVYQNHKLTATRVSYTGFDNNGQFMMLKMGENMYLQNTPTGQAPRLSSLNAVGENEYNKVLQKIGNFQGKIVAKIMNGAEYLVDGRGALKGEHPVVYKVDALAKHNWQDEYKKVVDFASKIEFDGLPQCEIVDTKKSGKSQFEPAFVEKWGIFKGFGSSR